uniref:Uncharacterized protein n=1 Tax=Oryza meridionalis TaxID=40149 RepID=A0A0E0DNF8_9ORYZ
MLVAELLLRIGGEAAYARQRPVGGSGLPSGGSSPPAARSREAELAVAAALLELVAAVVWWHDSKLVVAEALGGRGCSGSGRARGDGGDSGQPAGRSVTTEAGEARGGVAGGGGSRRGATGGSGGDHGVCRCDTTRLVGVARGSAANDGGSRRSERRDRCWRSPVRRGRWQHTEAVQRGGADAVAPMHQRRFRWRWSNDTSVVDGQAMDDG